MSQKKSPEREPGAKSGMISDDFLTPPRKHGPVPSQDEAEENPTEYWLHVAWDGEEVRYPSELSKRHRGYLINAVYDIDYIFHKGYAEKHPELIAAYMQAATIDFSVAMTFKALNPIAEALCKRASKP